MSQCSAHIGLGVRNGDNTTVLRAQNKEKDLETLFSENDIELFKISDEEKVGHYAEGGVDSVIEVLLRGDKYLSKTLYKQRQNLFLYKVYIELYNK